MADSGFDHNYRLSFSRNTTSDTVNAEEAMNLKDYDLLTSSQPDNNTTRPCFNSINSTNPGNSVNNTDTVNPVQHNDSVYNIESIDLNSQISHSFNFTESNQQTNFVNSDTVKPSELDDMVNLVESDDLVNTVDDVDTTQPNSNTVNQTDLVNTTLHTSHSLPSSNTNSNLVNSSQHSDRDNLVESSDNTVNSVDSAKIEKESKEKGEKEELMKELNIPIQLDPKFVPEPFRFDPVDLNIPIKYDYSEGLPPNDLGSLIKKLDIPCVNPNSFTLNSTQSVNSVHTTHLVNSNLVNQGDSVDLGDKVKDSELGVVGGGIKSGKYEEFNFTSLPLGELEFKRKRTPKPKFRGQADPFSYPQQIGLYPMLQYPGFLAPQSLQFPVLDYSLISQNAPILPPEAQEPEPLTVENWAQCENCKKWRRLPITVDTEKLPETWVCALNVWDPVYNSCEVPEEQYGNDITPTVNATSTQLTNFADTVNALNTVNNINSVNTVNTDNTIQPSSHSEVLVDRDDKVNSVGGRSSRRRSSKSQYGYFREYGKKYVDEDDVRTPTSHKRVHERFVSPSHSSRAQRRLSKSLSTSVSYPSSFDEECEVVKFDLHKVKENHPLRDRMTIYSENLTSLLATELPHSALFLDNPRKVPKTDDDPFHDGSQSSREHKSRELKDLYLKEDGAIHLNYAVNTNHSLQHTDPVNLDESSVDVDGVDDVKEYDRSDFLRIYKRLSTQIPPLTNLLHTTKLSESNTSDPVSHSDNLGDTVNHSQLGESSELGNGGDRGDEVKNGINRIIDKNELLEILYKFAKKQEERKDTKYCSKYNTIHPNLMKCVDLKHKLLHSTSHTSNPDNSTQFSNPINIDSDNLDHSVDSTLIQSNLDNTNNTGDTVKLVNQAQLVNSGDKVKLGDSVKDMGDVGDVVESVEYSVESSIINSESEEDMENGSNSPDTVYSDHEFEVEVNAKTERDDTNSHNFTKHNEPNKHSRVHSVKDYGMELEDNLEKKEKRSNHLDYPLPNVKQLSKRCRNLDTAENAKFRREIANYSQLLQPIPHDLALNPEREKLAKMLSVPIPFQTTQPTLKTEDFNLLSLPIPEVLTQSCQTTLL